MFKYGIIRYNQREGETGKKGDRNEKDNLL